MVSVSETLPRLSLPPTAVRAGFPDGRTLRHPAADFEIAPVDATRLLTPSAAAHPSPAPGVSVMLAIKPSSTGRDAAGTLYAPGRAQRRAREGYPMKSFANIVITGASSGSARRWRSTMPRPGRPGAERPRRARLQAVADACSQGRHGRCRPDRCRDRDALAAWLTKFDDAHPVDLLIANAGISIDKDNSSLDDFSIVRRTLEVNIGGVLNTVEPLVGRMTARGQGQIAVVSSLASFIGLPYSASYNASKAAVRVWGESIRYVLKRRGVGVSVVCPGFVVSRMTAKAPFPMPFLMSAERASGSSAAAVGRNRPHRFP